MVGVQAEVLFPKAEIVDGKLQFESEQAFLTGLSEGVFYVKIPSGINVESGIKFSKNFYEKSSDNHYTGFKELDYDDSILGYSDRHDQVEQLQLELSLWETYFPSELVVLLAQMNAFGLSIVEEIFAYLGVPNQLWDEITGGASQGTALQYCIFNHYRTEVPQVGITKHKDSGFITVLYSPEAGLEAFTSDRWVPVEPEEGYFTINLGHSFEILTKKLQTPICAVDHRVKQIKKPKGEPDRYSFGTYIGPRFDMNLYQFSRDKGLEFYKSFLEFQQQKAKEMGYEFHPKVKIA